VKSSRWLAIGLALLLLAGVLAALATSSRTLDTATTTVTTLGHTVTATEVKVQPGTHLPARVVTRSVIRTLTSPGASVASQALTVTQRVVVTSPGETHTTTIVKTTAGPTRTVTHSVTETQTHAVTVAGPTVTVPGPSVTVTVKNGPPPCTPPPKC